MLALQGYFDGDVVKISEKIELKKRQKLIITVLDEFLEEVSRADIKKSARGMLSSYADKDRIKDEERA